MRITDKILQAVIDRINVVTGSPAKPYVDRKPQAGCYHLSGAYGGVALHRMAKTGSGVHDIFGGHGTKRELYTQMQAWLGGYETGVENHGGNHGL
jgi:hypothetical protein